MNISELARILKVSPQELRDSLPLLGFDIGQKAIKIDKSIANRIIKEWPTLRRRLRIEKELAARQERHEIKAANKDKKLFVPNLITVRDLANSADVPINSVLSVLMKNGIFASLNEKIDFDTAWLVGSELGIEILREEAEDKPSEEREDVLKTALAQEETHKLLGRAPVIVVMGHVDHGKTKLLDCIRQSHVVEGEAGGITQHIGAYQVVRKEQKITFIDTPGHEAFTAMRSRGAKIADIAILVVAADDGVKPQTVEAFRIIEAAKIPFVVAINKVDKPEANIDRTKQELSTQLGITPEDWGGKTICQPVSALKGTGIDELLDVVLLLAETDAENMKANPDADATGTIIESHVDKGAGPVATILIQNGTLRVGDQLVFEGTIIGKVKSLNNYRGIKIDAATPATPAQIIGLKALPQVGDIIQVGIGERVKHKKVRVGQEQGAVKAESTEGETAGDMHYLNLIIKADALGSAEAIGESLEKINTKRARVKIIKKGLGNVSDGDIKQAEATGAIILGFNIKSLGMVNDLARERKVQIKSFNIIYDLINFAKEELIKVAGVEIIRKDLGQLKVKAIFKTEAKSMIVGGTVLNDLIRAKTKAEIMRDGTLVGFGEIGSVRCGKEEVTEVSESQDCGVTYIGEPIIKEGDILHFYTEEKDI